VALIPNRVRWNNGHKRCIKVKEESGEFLLQKHLLTLQFKLRFSTLWPWPGQSSVKRALVAEDQSVEVRFFFFTAFRYKREKRAIDWMDLYHERYASSMQSV
jgi:hypothetical protein